MRPAPFRILAAFAAAAGLAPSLAALTVEDKDLKLSLVLNLQTRVEVSRANDAAGSDYDVQTNTTGKPDTADFYIRRFRPGFKGTYQDAWRFAAILNADNSDRSFGTTPSATNGQNRGIVIHQAYAGREFKGDGLDQYLQGGLDYAFFNMANSSNSATLLPNQRASQALLPVRGTGAAYRLTTDVLRWGVDVQNNVADSNVGNGDTSEGLCYTTRLELTGPGSLALKKWQESYLNQPGVGYILAGEIGLNKHDRFRNAGGAGVADASRTITAYGVDAVLHWEGLNALAEWRQAKTKTALDVGASPADLKQRVIDAQVGYAFAAGPVVLEPAVRYSRIDFDRGTSETGAFSSAGFNDYGASGKQWDLGLNCYFNGHGNKLQLAYTRWTAESGDADANIIRLQHQLNF